MTERIPYSQLISYADQTLPAEQMREIEAALEEDAFAADVVARYRIARERFATDDSVAPTLAAIQRAQAAFDPAALPRRESWLAAVDRFIARCIFDSRVQQAGLRYSETDDLVNLSFVGNEAEIDLQAERIRDAFTGQSAQNPRAEHWRVMGQIHSPNNLLDVRVALTACGSISPIAEASADEHGTFSLTAAPARYDLHIALQEGVLVLPDIDMR